MLHCTPSGYATDISLEGITPLVINITFEMYLLKYLNTNKKNANNLKGVLALPEIRN